MYDIHVGDRFANEEGSRGKSVTVLEIDMDGRVRYEYDGSGTKRWADRDVFLTRFPIVVGD